MSPAGGPRASWTFGWALLLAGVPPVLAQDAERPALTSPEAARLSPPADYGLRYGTARFLVAPSFGLEYNDNISWSPSHHLSDLVVQPNVDLGAFWPITEFNALQAAVGVGYQVYTTHTDANSPWPLLSPRSALQWNIYAGDFRINLHDRFSYQQDLNLRALDPLAGNFYNLGNNTRFARFDNFLGFKVDWELNKLVVSLAYDHENLLFSGANFNYLSQSSELPKLTLALRVADPVQVGVEARARATSYASGPMVDRTGVAAGPFVDWQVSPYLSLRAAGGYDAITLSDPPAGVPDVSTYYASLRAIHKVSRFFSHELAVGREVQDGSNAQYLQDVYVRHSAQWNFAQRWDLGTRAGFLFGHEYGGGFQDHFDFYAVGAELGWRFHPQWRAFLAYDFAQRLSDRPGTDDHQNRVQLGISYHL